MKRLVAEAAQRVFAAGKRSEGDKGDKEDKAPAPAKGCETPPASQPSASAPTRLADFPTAQGWVLKTAFPDISVRSATASNVDCAACFYARSIPGVCAAFLQAA